MNIDALESLYTIFLDNIDSLYQEAKQIYDSKIKKDDKEEEKEENEKEKNKEKEQKKEINKNKEKENKKKNNNNNNIII